MKVRPQVKSTSVKRVPTQANDWVTHFLWRILYTTFSGRRVHVEKKKKLKIKTQDFISLRVYIRTPVNPGKGPFYYFVSERRQVRHEWVRRTEGRVCRIKTVRPGSREGYDDDGHDVEGGRGTGWVYTGRKIRRSGCPKGNKQMSNLER